MKVNAIALILAFGIFAALFAFFLIAQPLSLDGDAGQYHRIADNLIKGNGYSVSAAAPYKSALHFREPFYPALIALCLLIFRSLYAVIAVQALLHVLTAYLIFRLTADFMKKEYAALASMAVLLFPTLVNYTACLLSETVFTFLLVLTVYLLYSGLSRHDSRFLVLSGITCGISYLTKAIVMVFPAWFAFMGLVAVLPNVRKKRTDLAPMKQVIVFPVVAAVVIFLWHGYATHLYGGRDNRDTSLGDRGVYALAVRSELTKLPKKEMAIYMLSVFSEKLVAVFFPEYGHDISTYQGFYYSRVLARYNDYYKNRPAGEIIYETVKDHPFRFLLVSGAELVDLNMFFQLPYLNSQERFKGSNLASIIRGGLKISGLGILYLAITGMLRTVRGGYAFRLLPVIAVILYNNLIFIFLDAIPRYTAPIIPFYLLFSFIGIAREDLFVKNHE